MSKEVTKEVVDAIQTIYDHCSSYDSDCRDCPFGRVDYSFASSVKCLLTSVNRPDEILKHIQVKTTISYEVVD